MILPQFLPVYGLEIPVEEIPDLHDKGEKVLGTYDSEDGIQIEKEQSPEKMKATLYHEGLHAALDRTTLSRLIKDEDLEESIVLAIENWTLETYDLTLKSSTDA
jgi:hypothetical protein